MGKNKFGTAFKNWLTFLGVPCIVGLMVANYMQQKDLVELSLETKDSQIEVQKDINTLSSVTVASKNAQIELLQSLQSDEAVKRLIEAKKIYEQDNNALREQLKSFSTKLESLGVSVNKMKMAQLEYLENQPDGLRIDPNAIPHNRAGTIAYSLPWLGSNGGSTPLLIYGLDSLPDVVAWQKIDSPYPFNVIKDTAL